MGSIVFSVDGRSLLTRGGDDTVKCELLVVETHRRFMYVSMGHTGFQETSVSTFGACNSVSADECYL